VQPILIIVLATAASAPLGLWLRRNLATLGYRTDDEADLPEPEQRWWVVCVSVLAIDTLSGAASLSGRPLAYLSLLPLAVAGPWLAAVDFDVLRIPNRVLAPTAAGTLLAVAAVADTAQEWQALVVPIAAALLIGGLLAAVHFATQGGIGFGDVKLAALTSLAVGPLGLRAVWLSVLSGSCAALVWSKASRRVGPIPVGPWLLCGAWIAVQADFALNR
jgi:leader peptidase (prepilin peptidase)/N-methyltransferase